MVSCGSLKKKLNKLHIISFRVSVWLVWKQRNPCEIYKMDITVIQSSVLSFKFLYGAVTRIPCEFSNPEFVWSSHGNFWIEWIWKLRNQYFHQIDAKTKIHSSFQVKKKTVKWYAWNDELTLCFAHNMTQAS
jgi:hypothetical protein